MWGLLQFFQQEFGGGGSAWGGVCLGDVCLNVGGVCVGGVCLGVSVWGVSVWGVSVWGVCLEGVSVWGVSAWGEGSAWLGCLTFAILILLLIPPLGSKGRHPHVDRILDARLHACENITFPQLLLRTVTRLNRTKLQSTFFDNFV